MSVWLIPLAISLYLLTAWRLLPWFTRTAHDRFDEGTAEAIACAIGWPIVFAAWGAILTGRWLVTLAERRAYAEADDEL